MMLKKLLLVVLLASASIAQASVYSLPWGPKPQFVDANGAPMSSGTLTFYQAGTSTLQNTYTTQGGSVANSNPITLNTRGESPNEVWLTGGQTYKLVLKDSAGAIVWTVDNLTGVNDPAATVTEWVGGPTPTYVSVNSFTMTGDQTSAFAPGRRLKFTITAGTAYGTIYTSAFATVTTVTMVMDSTGNLDSGLSAVAYGFQHSTNPSIPSVAQVTLASATTTNIASASGPSLHVSGVTTITSFGTAPSGLQRAVIFDGALTLTHNGTSLILPGAVNITTAAGDVGVFVSEGSGNWRCISYVGKNGSFNNVVAAGTLNVTGASTLAGMSATTGSFSSTLAVTGTTTAAAINASGAVTVSGGGLFVKGSIASAAANQLAFDYNGSTSTRIISYGPSAGNGNPLTVLLVDSAGNAMSGVGAEVARWTVLGYLKSSNSGTYNNPTGATHEFIKTQDDSAPAMRMEHDGATATNQSILSLRNAGDPNDATRYFWQGLGNATERATLRSNGGLANFSANNVNLSDATVKTGLRPAGSYWNFIKRLQVVDGYYTDDVDAHGAGAKRHTMLTAQNVQEVERALRVSWMDSVVTKFDQDGHLGVQEHSVEMRHLRVTQELQARVESLEKKLRDLEARIAANDSTYRLAAGK